MSPSPEYTPLSKRPTKMPLKRRTWFIIGGVVVGVIVGASLSPVIGPAILGFSAAGPVAGSPAAAIQSSIGDVPPGGIFAHLQSMAMGGPIRAKILVYIIPGAVIGGIVGGLVGWLVHWIVDWFQKRNVPVKEADVDMPMLGTRNSAWSPAWYHAGMVCDHAATQAHG